MILMLAVIIHHAGTKMLQLQVLAPAGTGAVRTASCGTAR
jgi:hypothetical protein